MASRAGRFVADGDLANNVFNDTDSEDDMLNIESSGSEYEAENQPESESESGSDQGQGAGDGPVNPPKLVRPRVARPRPRPAANRARTAIDSPFIKQTYKETDKEGNVWTGTPQDLSSTPFTGTPGWSKPAPGSEELPFEWLKLFVTEELITILVDETNR